MKKILLIVGNYSPNPSSVGITIRPLIAALKQDGYSISLITNNTDLNYGDYEIIDDVKIYRISDNRIIKIERAQVMLENHPLFLKLVKKIINFFYLYIFGIIKFERSYSGWNVNKIFKKANKLILEEEIGQILTISFPFKSHIAALKCKKKFKGNLKWTMYEFDPFALNESNRKCLFINNKKRNLETKVMSHADKIFLTPELYDSYSKDVFPSFKDKMISIPYATLKPSSTITFEEISIKKRKTSCVFSGRLYQNIRNPELVVKLFDSVEDAELTFITDESGRSLIEQLNPSKNIKILPFMPYEENMKILKKCDILINIGNTTIYQVPGKLFELIGLGKPIIHFSSGAKDTSLKYLKKYPLSLIVDPNLDESKSINAITDFLQTYRGRRLSNDEIRVAMGEFTHENALKIFMNNLSNHGGAI